MELSILERLIITTFVYTAIIFIIDLIINIYKEETLEWMLKDKAINYMVSKEERQDLIGTNFRLTFKLGGVFHQIVKRKEYLKYECDKRYGQDNSEIIEINLKDIYKIIKVKIFIDDAQIWNVGILEAYFKTASFYYKITLKIDTKRYYNGLKKEAKVKNIFKNKYKLLEEMIQIRNGELRNGNRLSDKIDLNILIDNLFKFKNKNLRHRYLEVHIKPHLQNLHEKKIVEFKDNKVVILSKAWDEISILYTEERRHKQILRTQRIMAVLTSVLVITTAVSIYWAIRGEQKIEIIKWVLPGN